MKNSFKLGFLAVIISVSALACDPPKASSEKTPGDSTQKPVDTTKTAIDTTKKDTAIKK